MISPMVSAQETSANFSAGGAVKLGFDNRACAGGLSGAIRYNSSTSCAEFCNGATWFCPTPVCNTTPVQFTTAGVTAYPVPTACTSLKIEAYGGGGGYDKGGGGGGSLAFDGTTLLAAGGGGGGGGSADGGGGGGYGTNTVTVASIANASLILFVGSGGECVDGNGGEFLGMPFVANASTFTVNAEDSVYGGGGGAVTINSGITFAGDSTYGGGGGANTAGSGDVHGGDSNYGGGGGKTITGSGAGTNGSSTNGNAGTVNGGGGGGEYPAGQPNGSDGVNATGGAAANSGPGTGGGSACTTTAGNGKIVITPLP